VRAGLFCVLRRQLPDSGPSQKDAAVSPAITVSGQPNRTHRSLNPGSTQDCQVVTVAVQIKTVSNYIESGMYKYVL
jgi:hypothetical protein